MKIFINQASLSQALTPLQGVAQGTTTIPIYSNILLMASFEEQTLTLIASGLETSITKIITAAVEVAGSVTLNARIFSDLIHEFPVGDLCLESDPDSRVLLTNGLVKANLVGQNALSYPRHKGNEIRPNHNISCKLLSELVSSTHYSISTDESRMALNGACVETCLNSSGEKCLKFVTSDGYRVTVAMRPAPELELEVKRLAVIIPKRPLLELKKLLDTEEESVRFDFGQGTAVFEVGNTRLVANLINTPFPEYEHGIPKNLGHEVILDFAQLKESLRRVSMVCAPPAGVVVLHFSAAALEIKAASPTYGEVREVLDISYSGAEIESNFRVRFALDFLTSIPSSYKGNVSMKLGSELQPIMFSLEGDKDNFSLLMPTRSR